MYDGTTNSIKHIIGTTTLEGSESISSSHSLAPLFPYFAVLIVPPFCILLSFNSSAYRPFAFATSWSNSVLLRHTQRTARVQTNVKTGQGVAHGSEQKT